MKAFVICLAIAVVGVYARPDSYGNYHPQQQQWQQEQQWQQQALQWQQPQQQWPQQQQHQPQWQQPQAPPQMSPDGYKIVPGIVDSRCPRSDDPEHPIHLPVRGNCGKFMKCYGGRAYEQDCPIGLEFGVAVNRCDYPALAECSNNGRW